MTATERKAWGLAALGLFTTALLPRCSCEDGETIERASVIMKMTLTEQDSCSGAAVSRQIPDDYERTNIALATDFGSRAERQFEIRSTGSAPLTVQSIALSAEDPEFTLTITDAAGMPATLPRTLSPDSSASAPAQLIVKVAYTSADSEADLVNLLVKSDDPRRGDISFALAAGRGKLEVCGTNGCVTDARVDFGNVSRGSSDTKQLTIKNVGEGDLDLRDVRLESDSAEFCAPEATSLPEGVTQTECPLRNLCKVLKPGEEYVVNVSYHPADGGTDTGVVRIVSGDAGRGNVDVPINGNGAGPAICVCVVDGTACNPAPAIDFGLADIGQTVSKTVRMVSCGTEAVDLAEAVLETTAGHPFVTGPEFAISMPFATGRLEPNAYAEGVIGYTPSGVGEHTGGLRFSINQSQLRSWIGLVGRASACDLEVLPVSVNFGTIAGGSSADRNVVVANNGSKVCRISAITDPTSNFSITNKPPLPATVDPGRSINLIVRYAAPARAAVMADTSSFNVTSDEPGMGATSTVMLTAQGGGQAVCMLDVQPRGGGGGLGMMRDGVLNFGAVNIGYTKTIAIRISNTGNTQCSLLGYNLVTRDNSQFRVMPTATVPATINPGTSVNLDVTFAPTNAGGMFMMYTSLANHVDFNVQGVGLTKTMYSIGIQANPTVPTIDVIPDELDFGLVTWQNPRPPDNRSQCGSQTRAVRIYNSGTGALQVTQIAIDATSDPVFEITGVTLGSNAVSAPYAMMIPPGQSAEVRLRFFPTRINPMAHNGLLVIDNNVTMQTTVPLRGEGTPNAGQVDTFQQLNDNKVDILWVVDDSGSMQEEQNNLATNFGSFIGFADRINVDYQVGVITTEINDAPAGKLWACSGYNKILTPTDPNRVAAFRCAANVTNPPGGNRRPNPGGSDEAEAGLRAARLALEPPIRDMENAGFLRPDARLAVIVVSDEEDQSPGPVSLYVDFFRNIKGFRNPQLFSLSAIAGDVPNGCATAEAGARYQDAVQQLGGQFESVCSSSWQQLLQNIGLDVFALRQSWTLSRQADPNTIMVRVNGTVVPMAASNGWTYDATTNAITFTGTAVPARGSTIEIRYGAICLP